MGAWIPEGGAGDNGINIPSLNPGKGGFKCVETGASEPEPRATFFSSATVLLAAASSLVYGQAL